MIEAVLIAARFIHYVALALLFGCWAYRGFAGNNAVLGHRFRGLAIASSLLLLLGSAAVLAATIAGLGGDISAVGDLELWETVVGDTEFGAIWSVRLVIAAFSVAAALSWGVGQAGAFRHVGILLAGALVTLVAWTGHAAIEEGFGGQLHRWADALHLIAAAVWIGALVPMLWLLAAPKTMRQAALRLAQFHAVGLAAVLTLLATGVVNSYFLVGTPAALLTTVYGQLLAVKLLLFAGMVGLAAANRFKHAPALARSVSAEPTSGSSAAALRRSIRGELIMALIVLLIVAVLGAIAPAASA